jgi:uncharacterized membrane protein YjgN (DUF898 family)
VGAVTLLTVLLFPWLWFQLKKYQHDNYALGQMKTELRTDKWAFYGVFLKTAAVFLVVLLAMVGVLLAIGVASFAHLVPFRGDASAGVLTAIVVAIVVGTLGLLAIQIIPRPYFTSRMQNLLWSRTGNNMMRFKSKLKFGALLKLTLKNWLLMVLTLGLYWPFAAVALTRIRLHAVSVVTRVDPADLVDEARSGEVEAAGDAAGDLLGLDIGL